MKIMIQTRLTGRIAYGAALLAGGCLLNGAPAHAQQVLPNPASAPVTVAAPVVSGAPVRDAMAIQNAFTQVSRAVEPAVVTVTTRRTATTNQGNGGAGRRNRNQNFENQNYNGAPAGQNAPGQASFDEYLQQFEANYGFAPNRAQRRQLRERFEQNNLREVQQDAPQGRGQGLGSGMIFRSDGYILTNAHVVSGANTVSVKLADDREFNDAKVIGVDEISDVAVLKINATNLPAVQLGDSARVEVGDWAIAIGNPFGLDHTMTVGVISAKAREMPFNRRSSADYLQTDASINPGNSGGPLCDINGRVIGINNAIYSRSGGNVGIGFAIPINTAKAIADQLVTSGKVTRSYMGVTIATLDETSAREFNLAPAQRGVVIAEVGSGTPGQRAGLQRGDVVQSVNGLPITKSSELQRAVELLPAGSNARLQILRDGKAQTLEVQVDSLKQ